MLIVLTMQWTRQKPYWCLATVAVCLRWLSSLSPHCIQQVAYRVWKATATFAYFQWAGKIPLFRHDSKMLPKKLGLTFNTSFKVLVKMPSKPVSKFAADSTVYFPQLFRIYILVEQEHHGFRAEERGWQKYPCRPLTICAVCFSSFCGLHFKGLYWHDRPTSWSSSFHFAEWLLLRSHAVVHPLAGRSFLCLYYSGICAVWVTWKTCSTSTESIISCSLQPLDPTWQVFWQDVVSLVIHFKELNLYVCLKMGSFSDFFLNNADRMFWDFEGIFLDTWWNSRKKIFDP